MKKGVSEEQAEAAEVAPGAPLWMAVRPIRTSFKRDLTIDLKSLAFLADSPNTLERLATAERLYFDLVETIDEYNEVHLEIQKLTAEKFGADAKASVAEFETALPGNPLAQANTLLSAIFHHIDDDEAFYRAVAGEVSREVSRRSDARSFSDAS